MAVVRLKYVSECGKSMVIKVVEGKPYIQLKYGKKTIKYGKSTVLYGNIFWCLLYV